MSDADTKADLKRKALQFDYVRQALGYLGLGLPLALFGWSLVSGNGFLPSISDYYHTAMGDVLVGVLWSIGFFLLAYLGYRQTAVEAASPRLIDRLTDFWVAKAAGIGAIGVAQFPVRPIRCIEGQVCNVSGFTQHADFVHYGFAGLFFGCTAIFCLVLFPRGGATQGNIATRDGRPYAATVWTARNSYFWWCGMVILAAMAGLGLYLLAWLAGLTAVTNLLDRLHFFLLAEVAAILAFAAAWLEKGRAVISPLQVAERIAAG